MIEESPDKQNAYLAVHIPHIQRQCGSNDCGVFAIAFALHAAALGQCVGDIKFDQSKMRNQLLQCFKTSKLHHSLLLIRRHEKEQRVILK